MMECGGLADSVKPVRHLFWSEKLCKNKQEDLEIISFVLILSLISEAHALGFVHNLYKLHNNPFPPQLHCQSASLSSSASDESSWLLISACCIHPFPFPP